MATLGRVWLLALVGLVLAMSLAWASAPTVSVTLAGPDEGWYDDALTFSANGSFTLDGETQKECQDGEATVSDEYSWSYSPATLVAGGGAQDSYVTVRYSQQQAGQTYTVSVTYTVTVTYKDGTSDSGSATASKSVTIKKLQVAVSSNKTSICAGAVQSSPHQALISAMVTGKGGAPLSGQTVTFSVTTNPSDYPASVSPTSETTGVDGVAQTTLTSSRRIGATATVTATCGSVEASTNPPVTMGKASDSWAVDPQELIADGESTANVDVTLRFNGYPVDQHSMRWRIFKVYDESGTLIYTADVDPTSVIEGYGNVDAGPIPTESNGVSESVYQVGTRAGTICFEATDETVIDDSGSGSRSSRAGSDNRASQSGSMGGAKYISPDVLPTKFAVTQIKASNNVQMQVKVNPNGPENSWNYHVHDNVLYKAAYSPSPPYDIIPSKRDQPVCDARNHNFLSNIEISPFPADRSFANLTWRYHWRIMSGNTMIGEDTKNGSGKTGQFNITVGQNVGIYDLVHMINVYQNNQWKSNLEETSELFQIYARPPVSPENPPKGTALWWGCGSVAGGANTIAGCAAAIMGNVHGSVGYNPGDPTLDEPLLNIARGHGQCADHANLMCCILRSIGIDSSPESWWGGQTNHVQKMWQFSQYQQYGSILLNSIEMFGYHVIARVPSLGRWDSAMGHSGNPVVTHVHPDYQAQSYLEGYPFIPTTATFTEDWPTPMHVWP